MYIHDSLHCFAERNHAFDGYNGDPDCNIVDRLEGENILGFTGTCRTSEESVFDRDGSDNRYKAGESLFGRKVL